MRIDRVEMYQITMPLVSPFETSGWVKTHEERILVALHSECVAFAGFLVELHVARLTVGRQGLRLCEERFRLTGVLLAFLEEERSL